MKNLLKALRYILLLAAGLALAYLAFRGVHISDIGESLAKFDYLWLVPVVLIALLSHYLRGWRWRLLIEPVSQKAPTNMQCTLAVMTGYLANLALPRMGELTRCITLSRRSGIGTEKLLGTVVAERLIDLLSLALIVLLTLALQFEVVMGYIGQGQGPETGASIRELLTWRAGAIFLLVLVSLMFVGLWLWKRYRHHRLAEKAMNMARGFGHGLLAVRQVRNFPLFLVLSVCIWVLYYIPIYMLCIAFAPTAHLGALAALTVYTMGSIGFVVPVQGGIGAYHVAVIHTLMVYGIAEADAAAYALASHGFQTLLFIVVGAISFFLLTSATRQRKTAIAHAAAQDVPPQP